MQDTIRNMALFGISFWEMVIFYYLIISKVLSFKKIEKIHICIMTASAAVLSYISMFNRSVIFFSYILFALVIIIMCIIAVVIEKENIVFKIILAILYNELIALIDFFLAFFGIEIMGLNFTEEVFVYSNSWYKIAIYVISRGIMTLLVTKVCRYNLDILEYKKILLVTSFVLMIFLNYYQYNMVRMLLGELPLNGGRMGLSLMFILFSVFVFCILCMKNQMIKKENEILIMREELIRDNYLKLEKEIDNNRILIHDIKHDLVILGEFVNDCDVESIRNYLSLMGANLKTKRTVIWTQNKVWDLILQQKKQEAEQKGIIMNIDSMIIPTFPFDEREGCSLFGNLLDNAIEACEKVSEGNKIININIERNNQILFIKVENTIEVSQYDGVVKTSKKNKNIHGYGLKSVKRIIDKYEGVMAYHIKDNYFIIKLSFFDIEKNEKENDYGRKKKGKLRR